MRTKFKVLERPIKCISDNCKEKMKLVRTYIIRESICPVIPDFIEYNRKRYTRKPKQSLNDCFLYLLNCSVDNIIILNI